MSKEQLEAYLKLLEETPFVRGVGFRVSVDGEIRTFTAGQMAAERKRVQDEIDALTPGLGEAAAVAGRAIGGALTRTEEERASKERRQQLTTGQEKLASKQDSLVKAYNTAIGKVQSTAEEIAAGSYKTEKDLAAAEKKALAAEKALNQAGLFVAPDGSIVRQLGTGQTQTVYGVPTGVRERVAVQTTATEQIVDEEPAATDGAGTGAGTTTGTGRGKTGASAAQNDFINREIKNRGLSDTAANRKRLRDEYKKMSSSDGWLETFKQDYPGYEDWTTQEVAAYFGQDFIDVLMKVSSPDVEYSDEEIARLIRQTNYFNTTNKNQQDFDKATVGVQNQMIQTAIDNIRTAYGDIQFSEADLQALGRKAARDKLTGVGLKQEVFRTAFRAPTVGAQTQALTGAEADAIQAIARSFGRSATNDEIQSILTGQATKDGRMLTTEMFRQQLQQEAIAAFPQLEKQIQAGLSLDTIGSRYKAYAAELLEKDPEQIDMFSGPYLDAFGTAQTGPLSLGEWTQKVKSDSRFGWQYTNQANQQATDIALTLARAFGKVQ